MTKNLEKWILKFIKESNAIEGIKRKPTAAEIEATFAFLEHREITIADLQQFVMVCQPGAVLREKKGQNVRIGNYTPLSGGKQVRDNLQLLLDSINDIDLSKSASSFMQELFFSPYLAHYHYEKIHPFMDGNGRSGRVLWLWQMLKRQQNLAPMGFLQTHYYQSLSEGRNK